jgi:hypothetical protein
MQSDITTTGGNQTGFVITEGLLQGLNTASATAGDPVWLGVNGALIYGLTNKPYAPAHLVFIGIVTKISAGNGEIWVKVQNGFELKEIHDVDLITTTPINGHLLGFDGTLWVNKTIATWLGFTPFQLPALTSGSVLFSNGTTIAQDNAQLFWDDTNNRLGIGTNAPAYGLDVNGTARVSGIIYLTLGARIGTTTTTAGIFPSGTSGRESLNLRSSLLPTDTGNDVVITNGQGDVGNTSSIRSLLTVARSFAPTSGTGVYNLIQVNPTINQTGGANGITRGLYINPTLTAAADFRAIEVANGVTVLAASVAARASLRIPSGTAPTTPTNGDIWFDGTDLKMRIGGVTKTFTLL